MLFERLNSMQTFCIERVARWFAYHLSNFKFQWNWADWASALEENSEMPRPKFISEVLHLLLEYSYYQNVVSIVPTEFTVYLPSATGSIFKYAEAAKEAIEAAGGTVSGEFLLASEVAHRLMTALKSRCTAEEANVKLKELEPPKEEEIEADEEEEVPAGGDEEEADSGGSDAGDEKRTKMTKKERQRQYGQNRLKVDVLFTCLLNLGNKSLSHTHALLDK